MRKSKNYYKFMEYMAFGISGWHENAVMVDNGVIECVAYAKVEHIEDYSKLYKCNYDKMAMDSDNTWLTIKCVLVNEEVINVYYVTNERNRYIGQLILDDYRTQKQALDAIHKKVVCFFLNSREFCEFHATEEELTETTHHDEIDTSQPRIYIDTDNIKYLMETHSFPSTPTHESTCKHGMKMTDIVVGFNAASMIADGRMDICRTCPADRQGNRCCGKEWCKETWKRYEAIIKPEWHNVSLATLANIDFDMLDEKRQTYLTAFRDLQKTLSYLRKCKTQDTYDTCFIRYIRRKKNMLWAEGKISNAMRKFIEAKLSMQNVESGVWASKCEEAAGYHESRRYNKSRVGK